MLPLAVVLAYGCGMAEHLQLPDRRHGIGIEPQTDVSDDRIVGYEGYEMLRTAVREYYRSLGYSEDLPYMAKDL